MLELDAKGEMFLTSRALGTQADLETGVALPHFLVALATAPEGSYLALKSER